jgi:tripartite-type tricarboxylate transporter receptor subunit TctC
MGFGVIPESVSGGQSSGSRTGPAAGGSASVSPLTGDVAAFSRWARANAATATFGSGGAGGTTHLYGLQIAQALDLPLRHVPYKGAAPAIADVVAGHVASTVQPLGTLLVQARAGRLAIVASSGSRRSVSAPEVPTFAEVGYPQLAADFWFGLFGPPGLSAEVAARLNGHVLQAMRHAQVRERLRALDLDVREMSAAAFASQIESDWRRWREAIRSSGFNGDSE